MDSHLELGSRSNVVGTVGYRAPEITMKKGYDQSVDIFSVGVVLFIMLTGQRPFHKVFEQEQQQQQYQKTKRYSLLFSNNKQYWREYIGYNFIVCGEAKDLLLKMLEFDPRHRISVRDILKREWYSGQTLQAGFELQQHIQALLNRRMVNDDLNILPSDHSDHSSTGDAVEPSIPPIVPLSIDETDPTFVFTRNSRKLIFETLEDCIEKQLKGKIEPDKHHNVMLYHVPENMNENKNVNESTDESIDIEFAASIYLSRRWNSRTMINSTLNSDSESQPETKIEFEPIYLVAVREINGNDDKLAAMRKIILKALEAVDCMPISKLQSIRNGIQSNDKSTSDIFHSPVCPNVQYITLCVQYTQ